MKQLTVILLTLTMIACSPTKRFTRLIEKYPYLITTDTVLIKDTITLYVPEVTTDTVVTIQQLTDTITLTKERVTVKAWYVPKEKLVYIQGKCDPIYITKIVERKVPVKYYEKYPWWKKLLNNLLAIFIIFALLYALHRAIKTLL
jgi:hypothetical protein